MLTTTQRGYGTAHQRRRRVALAALVDGTPCPRCQRPMSRTQTLDLGHDDTVPGKRAYTGLEHARCNRSAGASKGNRARGSTPTERRCNPSRAW